VVFFFQAEDGIRDKLVTGVQTCALPISMPRNTRRGLEAMGVVLSPTLFVPLGMDLRGADTMAARVGYNLATGLDDRGIMYLRFGPPDASRLGGDNTVDPQCNTDELERWRYAEWGEVRFVRPSAFSD